MVHLQTYHFFDSLVMYDGHKNVRLYIVKKR